MQKLAFSTNAFKKSSLDNAIDEIASIGYRGVELMADIPHAYPPTFSRTHRQSIREHLTRLNLAVSNVNAFTLFALGDTYHPTWIESDAALVQSRIDHTIACIKLAREFESRTISIQPGGPLIGSAHTRESASDAFATALKHVLPAAHTNDVIIAIEPEPGLLIETSREYIAFKQGYFDNDPHVKMNCDVGHLFCVGESPHEVIRSLGGEIAHVHLEDIGKNRVHQHLTPGKGAIDFAAIFAALDSIAYDGWVTVELYPYETTAAGVARRAFEHLSGIIGS